MSAEVLRAAARLMRGRAEAATAFIGPMTFTSTFGSDYSLTYQHYQHMTPAVALAVADLLDFEANRDEFLKRHGSRGHDDESWCVKVARAYLGESA